MAKKIVPCADWIVAVTRSKERITTGGIVLTQASDAEDQGEVVAVGPDVTRCAVGDTVIFGRCRLKTGEQGEFRYMIQEADILGLLVDE